MIPPDMEGRWVWRVGWCWWWWWWCGVVVGGLGWGGVPSICRWNLSQFKGPGAAKKLSKTWTARVPGWRAASCSLSVFHCGDTQGCNIAPLLLLQWENVTEEIEPGNCQHWIFFFWSVWKRIRCAEKGIFFSYSLVTLFYFLPANKWWKLQKKHEMYVWKVYLLK